MAVSKIRKTSSWIFLLVTIINIVVLLAYYGGGYVDPTEEVLRPVNVDVLLFWLYTLLGSVVGATLLFAGWQMVKLLKEDPKAGLLSIGAIVLMLAMMFFYYTIGDDTPLNLIGYEGTENVPFWLKLSDMWLYSIYTLLGVNVACIAWSSIKRVLAK